MKSGRKVYIVLLIIGNSLTLFCQNLEIVGGPNLNIFYDFNNDPHIVTHYTSDLGYTARFGIENIKVDWLNLRFTLSYDKYCGTFETTFGGQAGGYTSSAVINKSIVTFGIFPLNFRFKNRIDLNFGFEISRLINESFKGTIRGWSLFQPDYSYDLQERFNRFNSLVYYGVRSRIAYDFILRNSYVISPQYSYYFGLSNEFKEFPDVTKSMRHYFCIGIKKKIK